MYVVLVPTQGGHIDFDKRRTTEGPTTAEILATVWVPATKSFERASTGRSETEYI